MIAVSCTCGLWQIDATEPPDICPKCGAPSRLDSKATDYIAKPWEELDARGRMFGVFAAEGYSPSPIAIFTTEDAAADWMRWQETLGDDSCIGGADYTIAPIDDLDGRVWNSHEQPPEVTRG
jgi:hypothetical protein